LVRIAGQPFQKILDIKEGDFVEWAFEDGRIIIRRGEKSG
jgi:hypothetical protein